MRFQKKKKKRNRPSLGKTKGRWKKKSGRATGRHPTGVAGVSHLKKREKRAKSSWRRGPRNEIEGTVFLWQVQGELKLEAKAARFNQQGTTERGAEKGEKGHCRPRKEKLKTPRARSARRKKGKTKKGKKGGEAPGLKTLVGGGVFNQMHLCAYPPTARQKKI